MENKICPIISAGKRIDACCEGCRCAWWVPPVPHGPEGHCAMLDVRALPYIEKAVRTI